ncbi:MAG: tetratricopeptide repeat protein [Candidatus Omnitrophica bacterium]|nr:tetratricopeptide repeat protein [Candidatus Omnitrophota bacterium]MBU1133570.1 tetratricopeptide repeat protein [Candidatus Omnitrophota bacterium]MBU1811010.1 tetratricopeptide repeat protein [Candidatus Omnitrophota bacterium]
MLNSRLILSIITLFSFSLSNLLSIPATFPQGSEAEKMTLSSKEANTEELQEEITSEEEKEKLEINSEIIEKKVPAYTTGLKQLIEEAEKWIKKLDEEIKDAKMFERNRGKEEKVREHYAQAILLYQQGELEKAKKELEKVIEIAKESEMKGYIHWSEKRFKKEHEIKEKDEKEKMNKLEKEAAIPYIQALFLYKEKKYEQAYEQFEEVQNIMPDYKQTSYYLKRIPQDLEKQIEGTKERALKEKEKTIEEARVKEKKDKLSQLTQESSHLYTQALTLYKEKKYEEAFEKFKEVQKVFPDYSRSSYYLECIPGDIESQIEEINEMELKEEIETLLKQATSFYNNNQFDKAKSAFEEILSLNHEHNEAKGYLETRIPNKIKRIEMLAQEQLEKEASSVYAQALVLYKEEKYQQASELFKQAQELLPEYSRSSYYLKQIPKDIENRMEEAKKKELKEKTDSLMKQAVSFYDNNQFDKAKGAFEEILSLDYEHEEAKGYLETRIPNKIKQIEILVRQEEKEKLEKEQRAKEKEKEEKERELSGKVSRLYVRALFLYQQEECLQAFELFKQIERLLPDYRETSYYLKRISVDLEKQIEETTEEEIKEEPKGLEGKETVWGKEISLLYEQAINLYQEEKYGRAYEKFKEVEKLVPDYKATAYYLKAIPQDIEGQLENKRIPSKEEPQTPPSRLYEQALALYREKKYGRAYEKFIEVQNLTPDYKETSYYLKRIPEDIKSGIEKTKKHSTP